MGVPMSSFLEVVVPVRPGSHHACLRRQVEHMPEGTAVSVRPVYVAGSAAGLVGRLVRAGSWGGVGGNGGGGHVAGTDAQGGSEDRPVAGYGLDGRGLWLRLEGLLDLLVAGLQAFVEGEVAGCELGNYGC